MPLRALSRPVRIGTDRSGMETPVMALKKLKVPCKYMFSCDIDKHVKTQLLENFPALKWYDDLMTRDNRSSETPSADIYIASFPCQSFSALGLQKGFKDKRGMVFYGCADYIDCKRPRAFILENGKRLISHDGGDTMAKVIDTLQRIGDGAYAVDYKILDTLEHGVPQSRRRPRVYIIGIRRDCQRAEINFPAPLDDHWITSRGRTMNLDEMLRCQGMERCFKQVVSDRKLAGQIGNAMFQNVIERLLIKVLPAAGLVSPDRRLVDRWAKASRATRKKAKASRAVDGDAVSFSVMRFLETSGLSPELLQWLDYAGLGQFKAVSCTCFQATANNGRLVPPHNPRRTRQRRLVTAFSNVKVKKERVD